MAKLIEQTLLNSLNIDTYERAFILAALALRNLLLSETNEGKPYNDSVQLVVAQAADGSSSGVFMSQIVFPFNQLLFLKNSGNLLSATQSVIPDALPVLDIEPLEPSEITTLPSIPIAVVSLEQYLVWLAKLMLVKATTQVQQNIYADNVGEFQVKNFNVKVQPDIQGDTIQINATISLNWLVYMDSMDLLASVHQLLLS